MEIIKGRKLVALLVLFMALAASMFEGSRAITFCNMSEDDLETCKPAVTAPNPADPTQQCCKALSGADLACLCSYKNNSFVLGALGIDPDLAMALPAKCNLTTPSGC
ncbi:Bifunctional inhibitor/plant lipid transfer protein/seed storage helical domain containing protein [Trema orientale]|uniref:Bifunctional inhibitor/plant lipid transfer protein/seed storage helical domain containing protein n=1 Tax=Trema orientale TaxID=63057 RepID=A0A2P5CY45_TREOI|nr:Bifunctional inhibitor/plant lipid transfer protein/seed storage helical domain containing protein [Trema orientale]